MHFDSIVVLNHFMAPGVAEPSTIGGANAQVRSLNERILRKSVWPKKMRLTPFGSQANDLRFAGTRKTTISLFPFFAATFFFKGWCWSVAREELLGQLMRKCWNIMGKDKVMELKEKFIDLNRIGELIRRIEMMIEIILRNRRIFYRFNYYLNEVQKMRSLLYNKKTLIPIIESDKIKSVYHSASPIAQDINEKGVEWIRICCLDQLEGEAIAITE
uniref:Uncharacterized protein n=1 Tax=Solanum lycopersicum TaxID=4081 RepID=A0A3Q7J895_SOLLC